MKRFTSVGLSILVLAGVMVGAILWLHTFNNSVVAFRSPLKDADLAPLPSPPIRSNKVVVVLVGGLGYDTSLALDLPALEKLKRVGVFAAIESVPPTFSQTAWITLLSGASPEINDAPPLDLPLENLRLVQVDTLFARAHAAQLRTALLGPAEWRRLIPRNQLGATTFVSEPGPEGDRAILEAALLLIENEDIDLMLIHFEQVNLAGRTQGGPAGQAYQAAALQVDAYVEQISNALDLNHTTLVVLADHGQIDAGGYGGAEPDVVWQPLVMVGGSIVPGIYSDIHQVDIAPTLATLMGLQPPAAAGGRILYEMLRLNKSEQAAAQIMLAQQRIGLAQAYVAQMRGETALLPDSITADLAQALVMLDNRNPGGTFKLAQLAQQEADRQMAGVRQSRIWQGQWPRLILAGFIVFVWFMVLWRRQGLHAGSVLIAAVITLTLYHALYRLQGNSYSLSSLPVIGFTPTELTLETARRVAVSLLAGGGLMLIFFMLTGEEDWLTLLGTGYGFSVLVTFVFALSFFWGYWQNGWQITWHLPAVGAAYWQISGALEAMSAAALGLILPWPIMGLSFMVNLTRRRLSQTQAKKAAEPRSLPGLRM